ncbi:Flagellar biosynthesis protein FlgN [Nitrincola lacisaponensis]|uniref:Flagellar biosynthesis protein FlgN n=1 Tax=Nitrincola lacisaponensis TaxID=267850 RepID=A0A063Y5L0_9GAMM|nr:flagellar protein FlgN [Nitrincola lacisaponensis]KDE40430.1 Flagellar biosynthesis protein FlgN [Nitrincola lacisaponensis]
MIHTPPQGSLHESFATLTHQGCVLLGALQDALEQEHHALQQRDLEALKQTTRDKHDLLLKIEANIRERNQLLTQAGHSPSESGFEEFILELPESARASLLESWQKLQWLLNDVRAISRRNEQVLVRSKQNVDQLLALLQGHQSSNVLYDPTGGKGNYAAQRRIGKA